MPQKGFSRSSSGASFLIGEYFALHLPCWSIKKCSAYKEAETGSMAPKFGNLSSFLSYGCPVFIISIKADKSALRNPVPRNPEILSDVPISGTNKHHLDVKQTGARGRQPRRMAQIRILLGRIIQLLLMIDTK
jgi:hypothetical protein